MIPYGRQHIAKDDLKAVEDVLRSDWLTCGPAVPSFEAAVAEKAGVAEAVAVNSATSALHIACLTLGLGPGDLLWTSPNTFTASANCARYCGAEVDFVDIDSRSYNLSPKALAEKLRLAAQKKRLPKIVVPVHFAGQSCDMQAIKNLSTAYGFKIIEDASHAIGGEYLGQPVGNCRFSDITIFSFHPVKIITTAEGGMALTDDSVLAGRMRRLRSHGITRDDKLMSGPSEGAWYYQQLELGFNYRLTDLQAALGLSQLNRLELYIARRRELAARYEGLLAELPLRRPYQEPFARSAFHLYPVTIDPARTGKSRLEIFNSLRTNGIGVNVHYIPVHTQPYYRNIGFKPGDFPEAEKYYAAALSLPIFYSLSDVQQDEIAVRLREAFE